MNKIARVFARRTKASPNDELAFFDEPDLFIPHVDAIHVSVVFTYDLKRAEKLADAWKKIAPVTIGGPATGMRGEAFSPGMYLKQGYVITSRGCPNKCWFCSVWKREGELRELPITSGWNVLDDNLLACSETHIRKVFEMLKRQSHRAEFTGGLEAARLKPWHVELLNDLKPAQIFFAYDTPDDWEPLVFAAKLLTPVFNRNVLRAYVLIGFPKDTFENAEKRLLSVMKLGICPCAMLYRNERGEVSQEWRRFQRLWIRPAYIYRRDA